MARRTLASALAVLVLLATSGVADARGGGGAAAGRSGGGGPSRARSAKGKKGEAQAAALLDAAIRHDNVRRSRLTAR